MNGMGKMKNKKTILILILCALFLLIEQIVILTINNKYNDIEAKESYEHLSEIENYVIVDNLKVKGEEEPTILFGSDYQSDDRYYNTKQLLEIVKKYINPNLFIMCGDYRITLDDNFIESEEGILELAKLFKDYYNDVPLITIQGNHDISSVIGIPKKDYFETDKYIIYIINKDGYPDNQGNDYSSKKIVEDTSNKLAKYLEEQINNKSNKPIFIVTHVPLHYSNRNNGEDNKYAYILFDIINKYSKDLDIVFLFGHNHSGDYDDYIGGSINFISKGNNINIGGTNKEEKINFTYMNAGYVGFSNNTSMNLLTLSTIKITKDELEIQKYSKYGSYYKEPIKVTRIQYLN